MDVLSHILGIPKIGGGGGVAAPALFSEKLLIAGTPIAMWGLSDTTGTQATDYSGNNRHGTYSNVALGALQFPDGSDAPLFNGSTSYVNIYSASLAAAFDGTEGTLVLPFRVGSGGVWTDGTGRYLFRIRRDGSNFLFVQKSATNNALVVNYTAGGTAKSVTLPGLVKTDWVVVGVVWKKKGGDDYLKIFINGELQGSPITGLGTWNNGALASTTCVIGASTLLPNDPFLGSIAWATLYNTALSDAQIAELGTIPASSPFVSVSSKLLWSGTPGGADDWQGRAVLLDDGAKWAAAYRVGSVHTPDTGSEIRFRFSTTEGSEWTNANTFTDGESCVGLPLTAQVSGKALTEVTLIEAPNGDYLALSYERAGGGTSQWRSEDSGKTWAYEGVINDDTTLIGFEDYTVVGSDIYLACRVDAGSDFTHPHLADLYKSEDSGATWVKVGAIEDTLDCNEIGLEYLGGTSLLVVMRDEGNIDTWKYVSTDMGATWSARASLSLYVGTLQRPRMRRIDGTIYLYGRQVGTPQRTVVYTTEDGDTWSLPFYPALAGEGEETGYCDMLRRSDGKFYMLSYVGEVSGETASVVEVVFRAA